MRTRAKRLLVAALLLALMALAGLQALGQQEVLRTAIHVIDIDTTINPGSADFIESSIRQAHQENAMALVVRLDTPGGLLDSTRSIVQSILNSPVPIVVYVWPKGAQAASAGVFVTLSANVAAMAPGTNIGAAHPVAGGGQEMDETMVEKVTNDAAAWVESIANVRGRDADWAIDTVRESISVTAEDALEVGAIDMIAENLDSLVEQMNGRTVEINGEEVLLNTENASVVMKDMGIKHKVLTGLANPNLIYLFLLLAIVGFYVEFSNPGLIFPATIGTLSGIIFLIGTQILPINVGALLLILLAMVLFIMEVKVTSYGLLSIGGIICLALGGLFLFDSPDKIFDPGSISFRVSPYLVLPTAIAVGLILVLVLTLVVRAQASKVLTASEGLEGEVVKAHTDIGPDGGSVFIHGEIWKAVSLESIAKGSDVVVTKVSGLTLTVEPHKNG